ncbi:TetR family transcriptional regulator C-terminal domain-containing protein [Ruminococcaceae bacterium OttesenSCG-928-O06]|nr:TetR family transcriptional regulator C-terminal domain-containing protein [Ruminococcaceae bacterium OttesenSCG-928-O06]
MEPKKEDRRVRLTKLAICESLVELMQTYPISKISVKMLCEAADINRSTFYAHYKDQYALLHAVQQGVIEDVKRQVFSTQFFDASEGAQQVLEHLFAYGKENAALIRVLLNENGDASFHSELMELAQEKIMAEMQVGGPPPAYVTQYLKHFILGGMLSIMRYWLDGNCAQPPEVVAALMIQLVVNGTNGMRAAQC